MVGTIIKRKTSHSADVALDRTCMALKMSSIKASMAGKEHIQQELNHESAVVV